MRRAVASTRPAATWAASSRREAPAEADLVLGVPDSGHPVGAWASRFESGIPYSDGIVKNRYVGRTFIQPTQAMRQLGIRLKLNPLPSVIRGKRLVVIDDSIVRGNTSKKLVRDAARCRRHRGAHAHRQPRGHVAVLLRHRHRHARPADRREQGPTTRCARGSGRRLAGVHQRSTGPARQPCRTRATRASATACFSGEYPVAIPAYTARNGFMTRGRLRRSLRRRIAQEACTPRSASNKREHGRQ